ncbi:MAG: hypothetical protein KZQ60_05845 [Candidatus Thiodiazotropha sp. (ex Lucinoma aequizonata)]|nr:hypothetical protein [Candidatus Thiodiazotropha sp. (ex Lucinoma aequizonata)]
MPFISPFRSPFRPYNRAYAYRGLTTFAPLSMAVSVGVVERHLEATKKHREKRMREKLMYHFKQRLKNNNQDSA